MGAKVAICIATTGASSMNWMSRIMGKLLLDQQLGIEFTHIHQASSAVPDHSKNNIIAANASPNIEKGRNERTDENRNIIVGANINKRYSKDGVLRSDADYIMWLDDDTVPPNRFVTHLVNLGRPFVGGIYFLGQYPFTPLAYYRNEDGLYQALYDYPKGTLVPCDSIGMGCTLIHRSVYEAILDNYEVFQRSNGSLVPVHKDDIQNRRTPNQKKSYVKNGYFHDPLWEIDPDDNRTFPFYGMEYGRTEDHYFCEMAVRCGFQPYVDTNVECEHLKLYGFGKAHYVEALEGRREELDRAGEITPADLGRRIG